MLLVVVMMFTMRLTHFEIMRVDLAGILISFLLMLICTKTNPLTLLPIKISHLASSIHINMRTSTISCVAVILLGDNISAFTSSGSVCHRRGVASLQAHKTSISCDRSAFLRTSLATAISSVTVLSPTIAFADEDLTMPTAEEQKAADVSCDICLDTSQYNNLCNMKNLLFVLRRVNLFGYWIIYCTPPISRLYELHESYKKSYLTLGLT